MNNSKPPITDPNILETPGVDSTLCWWCSRDGRTCSWMNDFTYVNGWIIDETIIKPNLHSVFVHKCPLFKEFVNDSRKKSSK